MVSALKFARSHVGNRHLADFFANSGPIFFFISLDRDALWSCSRNCRVLAASPV